MKVLVTGAGGFIGHELAEALLRAGHEVTAFVYDKGARRGFESPANVITGDICDANSLSKIGKVDCIHHLAANSDPADFGAGMMSANIIGTKNLLDIARKHGAKFIFSSSAAVYGNLPAPQREDGGMCPLNAYGYTKVASEFFCKAYAKEYGLETVVLRYFNTYGIGEEVKGGSASMVFHFMRSAMNGETIRIYGDGNQSRDFVHVKDVVAANILAMEKADAAGRTFNVGTGACTSFNELVRLIGEKLGAAPAVKHVPNPLPGYQTMTMADISNARKALGFRPAHTLESGIAEMSRHYSGAGGCL